MIEELKLRNRDILIEYIDNYTSLRVIAKKYGLTAERMRQVIYKETQKVIEENEYLKLKIDQLEKCKVKKKNNENDKHIDLKSLSIDDLGPLSVRLYNALKENYKNVYELKTNIYKIPYLPNIGRKSATEIQIRLRELNII